MGTQTTSPSQAIALPKGGGAQKGMGEKFSPDLHTGTGNFSIPISIPSGRNGFQPALTLGYSTGGGNGPFGLGWNLSIPGVSRLTSKGIPRYRDNSNDEDADIFVLSGAEDLVPVETGDGFVRYRPRTEGLFAHITHRITTSTNHWEVRSKDGLISTYGTAGSRNADPAVIADPTAQDQAKIFAWRLTNTEDPFGNRIIYEYERDQAQDGPHHFDQLYLTRIRYVDYGEGANRQFLIAVTFDYEDRPDAFSDYRAGFEIRTRKRCKAIVVRSHTSANQETLVRAYELLYADQVATATELPPNGVSLLTQINVVGYDESGTAHQEMPPLEFGYSRFTPHTRKFIALEGRDLLGTSLVNPDLELVDLFGHGLPDLVELGGSVRYWRNLGNGRFDRPRSFRDAPTSWKLSETGVQILDANGDGRADLLVTTSDLPGYYPLDFRGNFSRKSFQRYRQAPSFSLEDPEVRLIDLTGDGVSDVLRSGTAFECYFNHPKEGWLPQRTARVQRQGIEAFPNVSFSDPRVKFADLSGDGLQDIAVVYEGRIDYWPNLGYGRWGHRVTTSISGRLPFNFDPLRVLLGDVDGDGLADLVYVSDREVTLWMNRSGNGWSAPITIRGTPAVNTMVTVRLLDLLGTGVPGLLWTRDADGSGRPQHFFLDFTGGSKPYLLDRMVNNLGAVTEVTYASSTKFYLRDQASPDTRWRTTLPFPVQVVERVTVIDELSDARLTTEHRYHHGYWDGVEREFRGFGMVEQLDTEVFESYAGRGITGDTAVLQQALEQQHFSPPLLTRTWFHQGPVDPADDGHWTEYDGSSEYWPGDPNLLAHTEKVNDFLRGLPPESQRDALRTLRGSVLRTELYALDGSSAQDRPYTITEQAYSLREEDAPATDSTRRRIFFPHNVAQRTTEWERGDDPQTQFSFTSDYDEVGQPRRQIAIACPRGWRKLDDTPDDGFLATLLKTDYAKNVPSDLYIRNRVVRSRSFELPATTGKTVLQSATTTETDTALRLLAESLHFYDGNDDASQAYGAFSGLPTGQLGRYGALVRTETLIMTRDHLEAAYGTGKPPYLAPGVTFQPSPEYPKAFVDQLPALAGYRHHSASPDNSEGYFVVATSKRYDFHNAAGTGRGLVLAQRDPLGHESTIAYDAYQLLPTQVTGPTGLTTKAEYDYRVLQPKRVIDPNGNISDVAYSPTGLVTHTWVRGKDGRNEGDRLQASVQMEYRLRDFYDSKRTNPEHPQPISVRTIRRIRHDTGPADTGETIETREYSDGFGRLLQTRTQGEDVRFGDAIFGGGELILPANQSDGTLADFAAQVLADRPVAYYRLNESAGSTTVLDSSGHAYHGTLSETGVTLGVPGLGHGDTGALFDDVKGRIVVPNRDPLNPPRITMEAVIRWNGETAHEKQAILGKMSYIPDAIQYALFVRSDGRVFVQLRRKIGGGPAYMTATSRGMVASGVGTHVAATYDGAVIRIYFNGVLDSTSPTTGDDIDTKADQPQLDVWLTLGNLITDHPRIVSPFNGLIDEVAIYPRALPAERIRAHVTQHAIAGHLNTDSSQPNVIVSGWQRYDNKGRVIEKYEPFYDVGWDYDPSNDVQLGQKVTMVYDPRGQAIRTVSPDGSEQRVIYGIPNQLEDPPLSPSDQAKFRPTPWEAYTYDANDNAGRTHATIEPHGSYRHHYNTPASIEIDALGRTIRAVATHRGAPLSDGTLPPIEEHVTRSSYDIQGNVLSISDALGRLAFEYVYDLAKHALRTESIDAGRKLAVLDAAGNSVEGRDAKEALTLHAYDALNRPTHLWARDTASDTMTLREQLIYDRDPADRDRATDHNLLGKLFAHYDEAGVVTVSEYDFKGNILRTARQVLSDDFLLAPYRAELGRPEAERTWALKAPRIDWSTPVAEAALGTAYSTRSTYDALNRIVWSDYPKAANGDRYRLRPDYNRAGALERVDLLGPLNDQDNGPAQTYVQRIAYNAKGQRTLIAYGNGLMTRYAYDPTTFRLARLRTERYTQPETLTHKPDGAALQDLAYTYDLAGNILRLVDQTPGSGVLNNPTALRFPELETLLAGGDALVREFSYDPLYRLVSASGRECNSIPEPRPAGDDPRCGYNSGNHGTPNQDNAPSMTALYQELYEYDPAGNMLRLAHRREGANGWNRYFGMAGFTAKDWMKNVTEFLSGSTPNWGTGGNHLTNFGNEEEQSTSHTYDATGNMVREHTERHFEWDEADRMKVFRNQTGTSRPTTYALYLYDATGMRVKKLVITSTNDYRTTTYIGAAFELHTEQKLDGTGKVENCSLHVMDDKSRIAIKRVGTAFEGDGAKDHPVQYHLGDHLGSSAVVVSESGAWINREEFFPYGETSFGSFARKRYRYISCELDESGLYYHSRRYFSPWLARWVSADPGGFIEGSNLYAYSRNSPITRKDINGLQSGVSENDPGPLNELNTTGASDAGTQYSYGEVAGAVPSTAAQLIGGVESKTDGKDSSSLSKGKVDLSVGVSASVKASGSSRSDTLLGTTEKREIKPENKVNIGASWTAVSATNSSSKIEQKDYDPTSRTGSWFRTSTDTFKYSAFSIGWSNEGWKGTVGSASYEAFSTEVGGIVGDWLFGLTGDLTETGPSAKATVGFEGSEAKAVFGETLANYKGRVGIEMLGLNVSAVGELNLGAKLGFEVGARTMAYAGVLGVGIEVGASKSPNPEAGWGALARNVWEYWLKPAIPQSSGWQWPTPWIGR